MALSREKAKGRKDGNKSYAGIPRHVMKTTDFRNLSGNAVRLLLWLAFNYYGKNNGDLSATHTQAKEWGLAGKDTLAKALKELMASRMITRTREGMFTNPGGKCALFALTWLPIDECPGKDLTVGPTRTPPRTDWEPQK